MQFLKPAYVMEKDIAKYLSEDVKFEKCCISDLFPSLPFLAGSLVPSKELDTPESSVRGEYSSWRFPPAKSSC